MAELRAQNQERIRQVDPRRSGRPWLLVDLLRLPAGREQGVGRQPARHTGEEYPELGQLGPDPAWHSRVARSPDGRIVEVLGRSKIADCFQSVTDSGLIGYEKPHPAIFEAALRTIEARPEESLYVGDVYSVDYLGARNIGMQAVLFDVAGAYRDRGSARVESLEALELWLKG